jgi:predicted ATP-grasp superfamily ATP-dependent carboligase
LRLLICEYVTGGGFAGAPLPPALAREGDMMLGALVKDVAALDGIDIVLVRDARLPATDNFRTCHVIRVDENPWQVWRDAIQEVDAVWPIAPETGAALSRLSELVVDAGRMLIGSRPPAVALTTSKRETVERLRAIPSPLQGEGRVGGACDVIPVVPTVRAAEVARDGLPDSSEGWVVKPDDGAGAEATHLFRHADELRQRLAASPDADNLVVQPYLPGTAASLSMLCRGGRAWLLSCNRQDVVIENDAFRFSGCVVGGLEQRRPIYARVAAAVADAIPDLWGYVGIDLVDRDSGPIVLEVNPRLTTSYVGLRRAIGVNPAGLVLRLLQQDLGAVERPLRIRPQRVEVGALDAA